MHRTKLSLLFFLQFFIWGSWYVTTSTYLLGTAGFSGMEVGLVYTTTAFAATVSPFLLGVLADRLFATERLLAMLHGTGGMLMLGISFVQDFTLFFPLLILYGLLYMPTFALASALSFHHLSDGARDFPRVRVWGTLAWVLAGLLISYLDLETEATPMRISAATSLLTCLYCFFLPHTPPKPQLGRRSLREFLDPELRALLRRPSFSLLLVCLTLISIPSGFYYSFTNPFLTESGMANPAASMSVGQMSEVLLMLIMPFFFVRLGFKWVITIGLAAWGVRYALFAFGNAEELVWMLWTGLLLHGVSFNFTALTGQIYIDRVASPHVRNTAQGLMSMVTLGLGALIGAFLAGEVVDHFTLPGGQHAWQSIWLVPAGVGLFTTLIFALFFRDRAESGNSLG